jgi:hypothetical protein
MSKFPKKGTPEYDIWILTQEYKEHCRKSLERASSGNYIKMGYPRKGTPRHDEWISSPEYIEHLQNYCGRGFPKKGTTEYNDWVLTPEYEKHCRESSDRAKSNPSFKISWNKERTGVYTEDILEKMSIGQVEFWAGGFCYCNVTYNDPPIYCEAWNRNLWQRIDVAQNFQSILSGKTKEHNKGKSLSRHHVYWQPKACCEWDEDEQGYYAWINLGNKKNPNWYKHYIEGDPNKFVLLTASEHQMIRKDKLKWIKIFEGLIKTKLNGVCYLTKDEMKNHVNRSHGGSL